MTRVVRVSAVKRGGAPCVVASFAEPLEVWLACGGEPTLARADSAVTASYVRFSIGCADVGNARNDSRVATEPGRNARRCHPNAAVAAMFRSGNLWFPAERVSVALPRRYTMGHRAGRFVAGMFAVLVAGVVAAWLARLWRPLELWPEEQRWPPGSLVRWIDEPYVEQGPNDERLEVRAGDDGVVFLDSSPIDFCVSFPATGAFCTPRSSVALIERAAERDR